MIRHIVMFTVADEARPRKDELIAEAATRLEALVGVVPGLRTMAVRTDVLGGANHDFAVDAEFDDLESVRGYGPHPAHAEVAEFIGTFRTDARAAIDFEI